MSQDLEFSYDDRVYEEYIRSIEFSHKEVSLSLPVIDLGSMGKLKLEFDDLEGGYKNYLYRLIHCDMDWVPSELDELEYISGFNNEEIDEFGYSTNAYSEYTHYELVIPNDDIEWIISGNFLLLIYDEDLNIPVITKRFIVTENGVSIRAAVSKPANVRKMDTHQELDLLIDYSATRMNNPRDEVYVSILQNGNWNTGLHYIQANYERGGQLFFNDFDKLNFPALKEFRNFDTRALKYTKQFVHSIEQTDEETNVLLDLSVKRIKTQFESDFDANGGFIIDNEEYADGDVSSEYVNVIFTLQVNEPQLEDIYLVGAFNDWKAHERFRMEYDYRRRLYHKTVELKQGYYNYMYAKQSEEGYLDIDAMEGSWFETENDYLIIAYYRGFGAEYDRILDVFTVNSAPRY